MQLRAATDRHHRRLETRVDAVARLSDPLLRPDLIRRYAALHLPADDALGPHLRHVPGLDFRGRSRVPLLAGLAGEHALPPFPAPRNRAVALGMLYVLEGSTLGGRLILATLAERGVVDPKLAFLDPYGAQTGTRWRGFLAVLERELRGDGDSILDACHGAVAGFQHAERVLCGGSP
jgi:heme oxygenase